MRRLSTLLVYGSVGILARLLLWQLPGLGRDEAAYLYWSHHPEPAYSPLLQLLLRLAEFLPGDGAWILRIPALAGGGLAIYLANRLVDDGRRVLLFALLLSPWWVYASSLIHPDALLLPSLLALCLAGRRGRALSVAFAVILAAWAKPSGLLALPVAWIWLLRPAMGTVPRRILAAFLATAGSAIVLPIFRPEVFDSLRSFASGDPAIDWRWRLGMGLVALAFLPGPALLSLAWSRAKRGRIVQIEVLLPAVFAAAFAFAALFWGQLKINWFLPAVVLWTLLPAEREENRRSGSWGLPLSAAFSLLLALFFVRPDWTERLEKTLAADGRSYAAQAGGRERAVSSTQSWAQRSREYGPLGSFVESVRREWGDGESPHWVISDDYGLAAQLLAEWPLVDCRMMLPEDGIFSGSWPAQPLDESERILILSVRKGREESWLRATVGNEQIQWKDPLSHPLDSKPVELGIVRSSAYEKSEPES